MPDLRPYQPAASILRSVGGWAKRRSRNSSNSTSQIEPSVSRPDEVRQRQRPHRVPGAGLHRLVDLVDRADALLVGAHGVEHVGHEQAVDDEARLVLGLDRELALGLGERRAPAANASSDVVTRG